MTMQQGLSALPSPVAFTDLHTWGLPLAMAGGGLVLGLVVRRIVLPWIAKWASKSTWKYDDIIVDAVRGPVVVWFVLIGLRLAVKWLPLSHQVDSQIGTVALVLGIFAVTWAAARFAAGVVRVGTAGAGGYRAVSLLANVARTIVYVFGILFVLDVLNINIGKVLAAVGVAGLAVGLALQDTLANFFAGIRILMAGKIRPGHYVQLENNQEGFIEDITWGQTTIRQGAGNLIIVPNTKLSTSIVTNYALPLASQVFVVNVGVAYGTDLAKAEQVAVEVAKEALKAVPEGVPDFNPTVRYTGFGDSSVNFFVVLQTKAYPDRWAVTSEFVKRLHKRFGEEGIEMPFPQRVVHLHQGPPPAGK